MKKRLLALLMVTVIGAGLLSACGGADTTSAQGQVAAEATETEAAVPEAAGPVGISDETLVVALPSEPAFMNHFFILYVKQQRCRKIHCAQLISLMICTCA